MWYFAENLLTESMNFIKEIASSTKRAAAEAIENGNVVHDEIRGVKVELKYQGQSGRGDTYVYSDLTLDGEPFGVEIEYIPYNIFKNGRTWFNFCGNMSREEAERLKGDLNDVEIVQDQYCDTTHYFSSENLENVVDIFLKIKNK